MVIISTSASKQCGVHLELPRRAVPFASYHFDPHLVACFCQCTVSCDEGGIQRFSKSYISGIISRQTVPQLPNPGEQDEMGIAGEWKIDQISESFGASFSGNDGKAHVAAQ